MGKITAFEDIEAWKKARKFTKTISQATNERNFDSDYDLKRQIRRASVSISSNIAEGFERNTDKEFRHFLFIAKASAGEVRSQLYLAYDLDYIEEQKFKELKHQILEISKLISGFIAYLKD